MPSRCLTQANCRSIQTNPEVTLLLNLKPKTLPGPYLEDLKSGLRGAFTEHLQQHAQQLGVLHVGGHHHPCALNHLHPNRQ